MQALVSNRQHWTEADAQELPGEPPSGGGRGRKTQGLCGHFLVLEPHLNPESASPLQEEEKGQGEKRT